MFLRLLPANVLEITPRQCSWVYSPPKFLRLLPTIAPCRDTCSTHLLNDLTYYSRVAHICIMYVQGAYSMQWCMIFIFRHVNRIWCICFTPATVYIYSIGYSTWHVYVTPTCWYSWYCTLLVAHPTFSHCIFRPGSIFLLTARAFPLLNNFHCKRTCLKTPPRFYPCEYFCQVETTLIQYIRKYFRWLRIDDKTVVKYLVILSL